jgi:hypothetical protein
VNIQSIAMLKFFKIKFKTDYIVSVSLALTKDSGTLHTVLTGKIRAENPSKAREKAYDILKEKFGNIIPRGLTVSPAEGVLEFEELLSNSIPTEWHSS